MLLTASLTAGGGKTPVLLELFTSEGCSSCPSADRLLQKLDREQSVAGADLIVLSEHVDYWNQLGWQDPFSSALYSQRQREYANHLSGEVYTPELVVDGQKGMVGSDEREVLKSIRDAARVPKSGIQVVAELADKQAKVTIHVDEPSDGVLYLALAHDAVKSQVLRGENGGQALSHVAVVYSLQKLGKAEASHEVKVALQPGTARVVAFVAKSAGGRVVAIGQTRL
jgi:hypothetical protein